jgi:hypothetical protein
MLKTLILADQKTISPLIEILDWITAKGYNCEIKSFEELFFDNRFSVWIGDKSKEGIPLSKHFYSVWFRRDEAFSAEGNPIVLESTKGNLNYNFKILQKLFSCFARKHLKVLSSYDSFFLNKLLVLDMAFDLGLDVPQTFLCNNKQKLSMFISKYDSVICKSSGENLSIIFNKKNVLKQYVVEIDEKILKDLPDKFFPTLFQQRIDKQMDIRIFYIDGKFFPMAILANALIFAKITIITEMYPLNCQLILKRSCTSLCKS